MTATLGTRHSDRRTCPRATSYLVPRHVPQYGAVPVRYGSQRIVHNDCLRIAALRRCHDTAGIVASSRRRGASGCRGASDAELPRDAYATPDSEPSEPRAGHRRLSLGFLIISTATERRLFITPIILSLSGGEKNGRDQSHHQEIKTQTGQIA